METPGINELNDTLDKMEEDSKTISTSQAEIIRSLPEKDRVEMFKAMTNDQKENGAYASVMQAWEQLTILKRVIIVIIAILILVFSSWEDARETIWALFRFL